MINILCVITDVRVGAMIILNKNDDIKRLNSTLSYYNTLAILYNNTNYIVLHSRIFGDSRLRTIANMFNLSDSERHIQTGKLLGYLTPIDIFSNSSSNTIYNADIIIETLYNNESIRVQIAPQKIVGISENAIHTYFQKLETGIFRLKEVLPFQIINSQIRITAD
jgi:hypothetical protein